MILKTVSLCTVSIRRKLYWKFQKFRIDLTSPRHLPNFIETFNKIYSELKWGLAQRNNFHNPILVFYAGPYFELIPAEKSILRNSCKWNFLCCLMLCNDKIDGPPGFDHRGSRRNIFWIQTFQDGTLLSVVCLPLSLMGIGVFQIQI